MLAKKGHYLIDVFDFVSCEKQMEEYEKPVLMADYIDYPVIEYVPDYILGEGVLGRCFPSKGLVQIDRKLHGSARDKVKEHEITHYRHPEWSEWEVRRRTGTERPDEL